MIAETGERAFWAKAANEYATRGVVLVLGAGVSVGSGLPGWAELLRRLGQRVAGVDGPNLVAKMENLGYSSAAIAGVIKSLVGAGASFLQVVREELYRDFPFFGRETFTDDELVESVKGTNSTLRAVAALCVQRGASGEFEPTPQLHAIVNFNLDAVLRVYSSFRYRRHILRTVERASATASSTKINTYYIHGFLQFVRKNVGDPEAEADSIVLAEDEYYDFFGKPFGMFSYTVLHLLREHTCFFIGLSMVDENLRRLLHYSYTERVNSYIREGVPPAKAQKKSRRHFAILRRTRSDLLDIAIEKSLANLGVKVAWLHDHAELPARLGEIYAASGRSWEDVY